MKTNNINIAIATSMGWMWKYDPEFSAWGWCDPADICAHGFHWIESAKNHPAHVLPSYTSDLNAIHEVEKVLGEPACYIYAEILMSLHTTGRTPFQPIHASALQRAEAYLRTIGKWVD